MMLSGHRTRSVFERYNIVSHTDLKDGARKLDAGAEVRLERQLGRIRGEYYDFTTIRFSTRYPTAGAFDFSDEVGGAVRI